MGKVSTFIAQPVTKVHYRLQLCSGAGVLQACGLYDSYGKPLVTARTPSAVTCGNCKRSIAFQRAATANG